MVGPREPTAIDIREQPIGKMFLARTGWGIRYKMPTWKDWVIIHGMVFKDSEIAEGWAKSRAFRDDIGEVHEVIEVDEYWTRLKGDVIKKTYYLAGTMDRIRYMGEKD